MRIGIIGAGLSGLATARTLLDDGCEVTVFEKEDEIGGVWARSRRYPGLATQNPRDTYAFSDFPMPAHYPDWPSGEQVQAYLAAYADRFGVTPHVRLRTRVLSADARLDGQPGWHVRVADEGGAEHTHEFDWLIVCNGVFSDPHVPELPGRDAFEAAGGRVLHTTQVGDGAVLDGRRVAVVGFAKSAADVACAAAGTTSSVTLVYRKPMWKMPQRFFGRLHLKYVLTTRFSEALFRDRADTRLRGGAARAAAARRVAVLADDRAPPAPRLQPGPARAYARHADGAVRELRAEPGLGWLLRSRARTGRIGVRRGEPAALRAGGVELADGTSVDADVVVFGTGFRQAMPFLPAWPPARPAARTDTSGCTATSCRWAAAAGVRGLQQQPVFAAHVRDRRAVGGRARARPAQPAARARDAPPHRGAAGLAEDRAPRTAWHRGICVVPFNFHYINDLLADMGARTWRTRNRLREYLMPVDPRIYADLRSELERKRLRRAVPKEPAALVPTPVRRRSA